MPRATLTLVGGGGVGESYRERMWELDGAICHTEPSQRRMYHWSRDRVSLGMATRLRGWVGGNTQNSAPAKSAGEAAKDEDHATTKSPPTLPFGGAPPRGSRLGLLGCRCAQPQMIVLPRGPDLTMSWA